MIPDKGEGLVKLIEGDAIAVQYLSLIEHLCIEQQKHSGRKVLKMYRSM